MTEKTKLAAHSLCMNISAGISHVAPLNNIDVYFGFELIYNSYDLIKQ